MSRQSGAGLQKGSVVPSPVYAGAGNNALGEVWVCEMSVIHKVTLTNPAAPVTNGYITAAAGPNTTTTTYVRTGSTASGTAFAGSLAAGSPDFTRNVVFTATHASAVVALSILVSGIDRHGKAITETLTITAGTTSKTATGAVAFYRVDSIAVTAAADASANTIIAGTGQVFGLAFKTTIPSLVKEMSAGSVVTNGVLVAGSSAANADSRGTYSPNTAPDGTKTYILWYLVEDATEGIN